VDDVLCEIVNYKQSNCKQGNYNTGWSTSEKILIETIDAVQKHIDRGRNCNL